MKAMILAAGVGSRLQPLTNNLAKSMMPIINKPVMEHTLNLLSNQGVTEVVINIHHLAEQIKDYFGDGSNFGINIKYSFEEELMGTAGGIKKVADFFDDTFIIISGDALTDIKIKDVYDYHKQKKALATICLKKVADVEKYGVVITDREGKINSFQEKPAREEALSELVNTGIYIFEPEILDYIPANEVYDFGKQLFPKLVEINAPLYGYSLKDYWNDVGSFAEYFNSHIDALQGRVEVRFPGHLKNNSWIGENVQIDKSIKINGTNVIGNNSVICKGVYLGGNVIIGEDCQINSGANLENVIIWDKVQIPEQIKLMNCILGAGHIIYINDNGNNVVKRDQIAL